MSRQANTKTPTIDRLAELQDRVVQAHVQTREIQTAAERAKQDAERLREELVELYASGDKRQEKRLIAARTQAEGVAGEPWAERVAGAERAATRVTAERDAYVATHHPALVRERTPRAQAAVQQIHDATRLLEEGRLAWHAEEQEQLALLQFAGGRSGREIPSLHLDQAIRDLRRAVDQGVPAPLPRGVQAATIAIAAHDDPDPAVREAARARLRELDRGAAT